MISIPRENVVSLRHTDESSAKFLLNRDSADAAIYIDVDPLLGGSVPRRCVIAILALEIAVNMHLANAGIGRDPGRDSRRDGDRRLANAAVDARCQTTLAR